MTDKTQLTARQQQVLEYIRTYTTDNSRPPTVREIGAYLGVVPSAAHAHLVRLEAKGMIRRESNISRGIVIL